MMSTPFGPLPPPPPEPARADPPASEQPATGPASVAQPPVVPPANTPDTGIRSLSPTTTASNPISPDESIIIDPKPMNPDDYATELTQTEEPDAWPWLQNQAESKSLLPGMLMGVGVLFAIFVMMRHLRRKQSNRPYIPPADDRIAAIHERATSTVSPIERAMSDAEELARRLAATMENKAARLELLIEEADRKLEELNRAVAQTSRAAPPALSSERNGRAVRTIDPSLLDRARVEQDRAERNGHNGYHEPAPSAHAMHQPAATTTKHPAPNFPADPVHRRVWALADDGMPATDIARSLNQPVGQVELILNLRKSG